MAGVTQEKAWFRKSRVCSSLTLAWRFWLQSPLESTLVASTSSLPSVGHGRLWTCLCTHWSSMLESWCSQSGRPELVLPGQGRRREWKVERYGEQQKKKKTKKKKKKKNSDRAIETHERVREATRKDRKNKERKTFKETRVYRSIYIYIQIRLLYIYIHIHICARVLPHYPPLPPKQSYPTIHLTPPLFPRKAPKIALSVGDFLKFMAKKIESYPTTHVRVAPLSTSCAT